MTLECISGSDGKEGIAKAANLLCSTYLNGDRYTQESVKSESVFTETDMASALKSVGTLILIWPLLKLYSYISCASDSRIYIVATLDEYLSVCFVH